MALAVAILHPGLTWQTPTVNRTVLQRPKPLSCGRNVGSVQRWAEPTVATGPTVTTGRGGGGFFFFVGQLGWVGKVPGRRLSSFVCWVPCIIMVKWKLALFIFFASASHFPLEGWFLHLQLGRRKAGSLGIGLVAGGLGGALGLGGGFLVVPALNSLKLGVLRCFVFRGFFFWREGSGSEPQADGG